MTNRTAPWTACAGLSLAVLLTACTPQATEETPGLEGTTVERAGGRTGSGGNPGGGGSAGSAAGTGGSAGSGGAASGGSGAGGLSAGGGNAGNAGDGSGGAGDAGGPVPPGDAAGPTPGPVVTDPGSEGDGNSTFDGPFVAPPEATLQPGVTAGKLEDVAVESKVITGGNRTVQVLVPNGYVAGTPVPFMVMQDGPSYIKNFKLNTVLDNMIGKKQLPMMICIFVPNGGARRSVEYDTLSDTYVRFVLEDVLPAVEKALPIKLTTDPEGRAAGGHSSGGIAAFTMGWQRPDQFHRILSHSGSYTNIRGGNKYPEMIKATPAKPLRVYLNVGTKDLGGWHQANVAMAAALAAQKYHHKYVTINNGTHNQSFPASILPEALLWLWRGYPIAGK